jgi:hypothetical protein
VSASITPKTIKWYKRVQAKEKGLKNALLSFTAFGRVILEKEREYIQRGVALTSVHFLRHRID